MYKSAVTKHKETGKYRVVKFETIDLSLEELQRRKAYLLASINEYQERIQQMQKWYENLQNELAQIEKIIAQENEQ